MKPTQLLNALLVGALILSPSLTLAETVAATGTQTSGAAASRGVVAPRDTASGLPTGKRQYQPVRGTSSNPLPADTEKRLEERDALRAKLEGGASTTKENKEERRDEMKEKMKERRSEVLKRHAMMMIERMNAAIRRESKLGDRIDSRIAKMKAHGADTTQAEANMVIVRTKIAEATAAVKLAEDSIPGAIASADASASSTLPSDPGKAVREALNKAKEAIFAAHKALVEATKSLKGIRIDVVATTTTEVTATTTP